jgi:hypothetical protein
MADIPVTNQLNSVRDYALLRVVVVSTMAVLCSACLKGYPQNEVPVLSPNEMTQVQRIEALNQIGQLHYLDRKWSYRLNGACELRVTEGAWLSKEHSPWLSLPSAKISMSYDKTDKTHDVLLQYPQVGRLSPSKISLIEGANWADAVHLMSLAQHAQQKCLIDA